MFPSEALRVKLFKQFDARYSAIAVTADFFYAAGQSVFQETGQPTPEYA
jgi:hypothetical protein